MDEDEVMTPREVAEVLKVSVDALAHDRYRNTGMPYTRVGRRVRYLRSDVQNYLAEQRVAS